MSSSRDILYVEVECCTDCHLHSWCSRHDEDKYKDHFEKLKTKLASSLPNAVITRNSVPDSYRKIHGKSSTGENKYYDETKEEFVYYPRFGSFEVYADKMLIFSKLKSNLWPKHDKLVRLFELIQHAKINGGDPKKYSLEYRLQNEQD